MATLDLAGIITRVCTDLREKFASKSVETSKQDALVSGTNIKTVNGNSLLGSGNISISNADSIGYQLRANRIDMTASDACGPNRLWFTSADGTKMVPINTSKSTSTTAAKTLNTRPIDPFGRITYYTAYGYSDSSLTTHRQWDQYDFSIGYSYVKTLTNRLPIYLKCTPQSDGSAVMADVVQALPTTNDGYIYIFLGVAYSTSGMELLMHHPVYYHDGTGIRLWTGAESGGGGSTAAGVTVRGARVTVPRRTSTALSHNVVVSGLGGIDAHDIVLFFGTGGYDVVPIGFSGGNYRVHVTTAGTSAFDAFAAIISPNYEVGSQASIVGSNASLCNTTTPLVGDTVTITATSGARFTVYDAASGGAYAGSGEVAAGGTYSFTVECATSYIDVIASGGGND